MIKAKVEANANEGRIATIRRMLDEALINKFVEHLERNNFMCDE